MSNKNENQQKNANNKSKKSLKRIDKKYIYLSAGIILGIILTLFNLLDIDVNSIFLTIGGGILCSCIVSLALELCNDNQNKQKILAQRNYVLYNVKESIQSLITYESKYLLKYINADKQGIKMQQCKSTVANAVDKIIFYLDEIEQLLIKQNSPDYLKTIGVNYWFIQKNREKCMFDNSTPEYKRLLSSLTLLLSNKDLYRIEELFGDEELNIINDYKVLLEVAICYIESKDLELTVESRQSLFKASFNFINLLKIKDDNIDIYELK